MAYGSGIRNHTGYAIGGPPPCHNGIEGRLADPNIITPIPSRPCYWMVGPKP